MKITIAVICVILICTAAIVGCRPNKKGETTPTGVTTTVTTTGGSAATTTATSATKSEGAAVTTTGNRTTTVTRSQQNTSQGEASTNTNVELPDQTFAPVSPDTTSPTVSNTARQTNTTSPTKPTASIGGDKVEDTTTGRTGITLPKVYF